MARHEQLRRVNASDAAAKTVGREHHGAKEMLVDTQPHKTLALQTLFWQFIFVNFRDVLQSSPGELGKQPLTLEGERFGIAVEFVPNLFLTFGAVRHAADSTRSLRRVEAGEVGQFVRNRANAAPQKLGELDYSWIVDVNRPERNLAIKVERENVFIARPVTVGSGHRRLAFFERLGFQAEAETAAAAKQIHEGQSAHCVSRATVKKCRCHDDRVSEVGQQKARGFWRGEK